MRGKKAILLFGVKALVATVLITLLVRSGALDFSALGLFLRSPALFAANMATWVTCSVLLCVMRWRLLLGLAGARVPLGRSVALQLTALFFNVVIPGNVGGDVVKALYVARDEPAERRPTILLVVFVERLVGLAGLVAMAAIVTLTRIDALWSAPAFRPMVVTVGVLSVGALVIPALFVLIVRRAGERIERAIGGTTRLAGLLTRLVASARLLSTRPSVLLATLGVSVAMHGIAMGLFTVLTRELTGQDVALGQIATVYPIGILSGILPIAPAGLGVGHLVFDRLFAAVGLTGGATVFNVFLLGQITPCLIGVVPYLTMRAQLSTQLAADQPAPSEHG